MANKNRTSRISHWLDDQLSKVCLPRLFAALNRSERMPAVNTAWHKVRLELMEVGLLYEAGEGGDGYLDQIELMVSAFPSIGSAAYVYDVGVDAIPKIVGFEEGVIYLAADTPHVAYEPGYTLADVIRHEYAHAWYWLEPDFVDDDWFKKAFGASYLENGNPVEWWLTESKLDFDPSSASWKKRFHGEFVSDYAATRFCEDFAESFMYYLRYRKSLHRFKKRPGVYRKLKAIESAARRARRELGT